MVDEQTNKKIIDDNCHEDNFIGEDIYADEGIYDDCDDYFSDEGIYDEDFDEEVVAELIDDEGDH